MCNPASFVLTKDRAFWSKKTDSHDEIIAEHGISADGVGGPNIVRVEITPESKNYELQLDQWKFRVDQDILPKWWDAEDGERRSRAALREWYAVRMVAAGQIRSVLSGEIVIAVLGGGMVQDVLAGGMVQDVRAGGTVQYVRAGGTVQYVLAGGMVQDVLDGGMVQDVLAGGTVQYVLAGGMVQDVLDGGTVQYVLDGGTVQYVRAGGMVRFYCAFSVKIYGRMSVVIDMTGESAVCHVGTDEEREITGGKK